MDDENHRLETYVNSYQFNKEDNELIEFFGIQEQGYGGRNIIWQLYDALNEATPETYHPIESRYIDDVTKTIDKRENNEGFCCYMARHNGKDSHGKQIYRSAKNTAKTRLLRESLFALLGGDKTISFCYRQEHELDDVAIALSLHSRP